MFKKGDETMWTVWDGKSEINGFSVERFIAKHGHLQNEETIFINTVDGKVANVEGKNILSMNCGIDPTLDNEAFIAEYERIIAEPTEEPLEE